jgi:hypothetical protein
MSPRPWEPGDPVPSPRKRDQGPASTVGAGVITGVFVLGVATVAYLITIRIGWELEKAPPVVVAPPPPLATPVPPAVGTHPSERPAEPVATTASVPRDEVDPRRTPRAPAPGTSRVGERPEPVPEITRAPELAPIDRPPSVSPTAFGPRLGAAEVPPTPQATTGIASVGALPGALSPPSASEVFARSTASARAPASVPAPTSAAAATDAPALVFERESAALGQILNRYELAYDRLDAGAASAMWPTVDTQALARAFARLQMQNLEFGNCTFAVSEDEATAQCAGTLQYVRRIGDRSPKKERHTWTIEFVRAGDTWNIARITAR